MELQRDVPFSISEVTADWLNAGLKAAGLLKNGQIDDLTIDVLGQQVGFNGEVAILTPSYSAPVESLPPSLVLKIPTASKNRIMGQTMGLYEKEIRFYRTWLPICAFACPATITVHWMKLTTRTFTWNDSRA